jgi:hypothetical protein
MGRRTRKRVVGGAPGARAWVATDGPAPHARTPDRRARTAERPRAPWAPFPLVELCILAGNVVVVVGYASDRPWLMGAGFALILLAALELSIREHLTGYRSHSALLAAALAVALAAAAYFLTAVPQPAILVLAVVSGGVAFGGLRELFRRRSGGLGFRA